jgi:REP element-mobilizing transposase RayT
MNRGINGLAIFSKDEFKELFLEILYETSKKWKIKLFAYCILPNHYHLILENSSGKMSEFMRVLNGQYGMLYRQSMGERGYVFQGRFKSTLIQDDSYLLIAISYVLLNPIKSGLVENAADYKWSSAKDYFSGIDSELIDVKYVQELYGSENIFARSSNSEYKSELPIINTRMGQVLGREDFIPIAESRWDRRKKMDAVQKKRIDDRYFEPLEKVTMEFERKHEVDINRLDTSSYKGKRLRGELLVHIKERTALTYSDIITLPLFSDLQLNSMGKLYKDAKKRLKNYAHKVKK